jgi:hypothetical protein
MVRLASVRLIAWPMSGSWPCSAVVNSVKKLEPDANDDGEHHHLDAGGHHIAEDAFGQEAGAVPERERHEDEPGQRGQLELDDRDEQLHLRG